MSPPAVESDAEDGARPEKIEEFKHKTHWENADKGTINVNEYGTVLRSGWGKDPSQEDKEWMGDCFRSHVTLH